MKQYIPEELLQKLSKFIEEKTGLYFPEKKWEDIERGIKKFAEKRNFKNNISCVEMLLSSEVLHRDIDELTSYLTIGETYFFREKNTYKTLEETILPELIKNHLMNGNKLQIWSAGCSTGEESYSIAMLINKFIEKYNFLKTFILGTDINTVSLEIAQKGEYKEWSFRDTPSWLKDKYFTKTNQKTYILSPKIRKMVKFSYLNLSEDIYPGILNHTSNMDIIFCRNVLMYFSEKLAEKIIEKFYLALNEGGWLLISPSEASCMNNSKFTFVNFPETILYRKISSKDKKNIYLNNLEFNEAFNFIKSKPQIPEEEDFFLTPSLPKPEKIPEKSGYEQALNLYENHRYKEASEILEELLLKDKDLIKDPKSTYLLARSHANQRKLDRAEELCKKGIEHNKLNIELYYLLATILEEENKIEEAVNNLKKVIYLDQDFVLAHFSLGNLLQKHGKLKEGKKYLENAITILDTNPPDKNLLEIHGLTVENLREIINKLIQKNNF